ncbi:MAG: hypothetical protein K0S39_3599 [Paenibacillus sp.]|nr:hypothetical protein [Paenibacillus sp.]
MAKRIAPHAAFILVHISLIFLVYPGMIFESTNRGHWQLVLIGCMLELMMLWVYLNALVAFPQLDLADIFKLAVGPWISRIVLLPLLIYSFASIVLLARTHAEILTIVLTPNTPIWVLMLLFLAISLFAAWSGIHAVLRASLLVAVIFVPIVVFSLISVFQNSDYYNALPLWSSRTEFVAKPSFYSGFFAFSGFLFLGIIRPHISLDSSNKKSFLLVFLAGIIPLFLASVYIPLLVFGQETVSQYLLPVIEAMDTIDLYWLMFDRVTIFYIASTTSFMILYSAILIWMSAVLLNKLYAPFPRTLLYAFVTTACYFAGILIPGWFAIRRLIDLDTGVRIYSIVGIPCLAALMSFVIKRRRFKQ